MKTTFHRIYTTDGLELHGLLYEPEIKTQSVLVHVHGMGGNFYENSFLDYLAKELTENGTAFCIFNNRGCEFIDETYKKEKNGELRISRIGNAYENFEDSLLDIQTYIDFVKESGFTVIHLSGHSLGCAKAVYYVTETRDQILASLLLLSPSDMLGLVRAEAEQFKKDIAEANECIQSGNSEKILSDWVWGNPVSARTYMSLFGDNAKDAIFNFYDSEDMLPVLGKITIPAYAVMGRKDDALTIPIEDTFRRMEQALSTSPRVKTEILGNANHGYRGHEQELASAVQMWIASFK
jgi:pimeloyl-ACP methyl ester carboxylesterase